MPRTAAAAVVALLAFAAPFMAPTRGETPAARHAEQSLADDPRTLPDGGPNPGSSDHEVDDTTLVIAGDSIDAQIMPGGRTYFDVPNRPAYKNSFSRSVDLEAIQYIPGDSNVAVDITTRLGAEMPVAMLSFAVINKNPLHVIFDASMTIYPDLNGSPDVAHPIASVMANNLWAPGGMAIGVARLYLGAGSTFTLPPGTLWFGVEISNIQGGDPQLFGQIIADNVSVGSSTGTLVDAASDPPAPITIASGDLANVDRTIIPHPQCRADWNMNAIVNVYDYQAFVVDYIDNPLEADYNSDGRTDVSDYVAFILDYMACTR